MLYLIELSKFFERIILRIDPKYQVIETAQIFLLATRADIDPRPPLLEKRIDINLLQKLDLSLATEAQLDSIYRLWHPRLQDPC